MTTGLRPTAGLWISAGLLAAAWTGTGAGEPRTASGRPHDEGVVSRVFVTAVGTGRPRVLPVVFRVDPFPTTSGDPTPALVSTGSKTADAVQLGILPSLSDVRAIEAMGFERFVASSGDLVFALPPETRTARRPMGVPVEENAYGLPADLFGPSAMDGIVSGLVRTANVCSSP